MPLSPGDKLGPYEILSPIGAGGMGEVYKARDTRLDRTVAVKVLPEHIAKREDLRARFEREARAVASLNHPNICTLHDIGNQDGAGYMVMEYMEGETLAARIEKGAIPLDQALAFGAQIADALDRAHRAGVTHRDVKPQNIMLTRHGVKVLDFGLAKSSSKPGPSEATLTALLTTEGTVMGTPQYMAPEQFEGKEADARSDAWAFGAVLYEMVIGQKAFQGKSYSSLVGAILSAEPPPMAVQPFTPRWLERLVRRCLAKDPEDRWQSMRDIVIELRTPPRDTAVVAAPGKGRIPWIAAVALLTLIATLLAFLYFREKPAAERTLRYTLAGPEISGSRSFAVSPDGRYLAIAALVGGKRQLWLRPMDALQAHPMPFTEGANNPFWSPDSRFVGFFAQGKLKKVAASGGPPESLCDMQGDGRGGSWSREDVILFAAANGVSKVNAAGGVPNVVAKGDLLYPKFVSGGRRFLYLLRSGNAGESGIYLSSLDGKENRRILADVSGMVFAPAARAGLPAHILFVRENTLMAMPVDASSAQPTGEFFPLVEGVSFEIITPDYLPAEVSENGLLLYAKGAREDSQIAWVDRSGKPLGNVGAPGQVYDPALSPDEKQVVYRRLSSVAVSDLWVRDLSRGTETRLTSDPSVNIAPLWSPKGDRIIFSSNRGGGFKIYQRAASGSGQDVLLLQNRGEVTHWSRDGRFIVSSIYDPKNRRDVWVLPAEGAADRKPIPYLQSPSEEIMGQLSPDSQWMAFTSDRSGSREVYVRPFPPAEGEYIISIAGGDMPRWRGDGKELFFEGADGKMMSVAVKAGAGVKTSLEVGAPVALFDAHMKHSPADNLFEYDVTADGKRFLINTTGGSGAASARLLTVVTNWQAGLKK